MFNEVSLKEEQGLSLGDVNYNAVFTGNPGVGKTTVSDLYTRALIDMGVLPLQAHVFNTSGADVANLGVDGLRKELEKAKKVGGGVIFIDEVVDYSQLMYRQHNSTNRIQVISTSGLVDLLLPALAVVTDGDGCHGADVEHWACPSLEPAAQAKQATVPVLFTKNPGSRRAAKALGGVRSAAVEVPTPLVIISSVRTLYIPAMQRLHTVACEPDRCTFRSHKGLRRPFPPIKQKIPSRMKDTSNRCRADRGLKHREYNLRLEVGSLVPPNTLLAHPSSEKPDYPGSTCYLSSIPTSAASGKNATL
eukprot:g76758.t1